MLRVMLVIDDYNELVYLQTMLKKVGFDVDGIQNQRSFDDHRLSFNPEVILATAMSSGVNGLEMAEKLKRPHGVPKVLLILPSKLSGKMDQLKLSNVDATITSPINPRRLLEALSSLGGLQKDQLLEKYDKIRAGLREVDRGDERRVGAGAEAEGAALSEGSGAQTEQARVETEETQGREISSEVQTPSVANAASTKGSVKLAKSGLSDEERRQRFEKTLAELEEPRSDGLPHKRLVQHTKELRASINSEEIESLDKQRQEFVRALFKKDQDK